MLAVTWAVHKCKIFLSGLQHFCILTDHNYLMPILNSHCLYEIDNSCLQHLKFHLMEYSFSAKWIKGSVNDAPDALSWNPISDSQGDDTLAEFDPFNEPEMYITEIHTITSEQPQDTRCPIPCRP